MNERRQNPIRVATLRWPAPAPRPSWRAEVVARATAPSPRRTPMLAGVAMFACALALAPSLRPVADGDAYLHWLSGEPPNEATEIGAQVSSGAESALEEWYSI